MVERLSVGMISLNFFIFLGRTEAKAYAVVTTGTILICDRMTTILFDPGSIFSYIPVNFTLILI